MPHIGPIQNPIWLWHEQTQHNQPHGCAIGLQELEGNRD